ncbi:CRTAC1 family protein [Edaphobacter sp.]|uniref:CRTAC1 family protein n=1 Tax=Edaphobacter sp. TaxID=1934404 RepID=UPI002DB95AFB|nr:CRTAC1 family protein [Edaphobacter sp.]HEU5341181.1 CRTAC1 family protein [Edaphobacter sp.]
MIWRSPAKSREYLSGCILVMMLCCEAAFYGQAAHSPARPAARHVPELVDITASTGIHFEHLSSPEAKYIVESMSGGVALIDYDGDGWPDIYFTNAPSVAMALEGKKARGALYHNNRDGTFTDVTDKAGVGYPCWAMGAAVGDYDGDGRPDLLISCFGGVVLYRNNGDGTFTDVTKAAGLDKDTGWATGVSFGDYDGDGVPDIFVPHYVDLDLHDLPKFGSLKTCQYHGIAVQCGPRGLKGSPDALYRNNGDGTFTEAAKQAGVDDANHYFGLGSVWTDFDNDGKPDLFVANDGEPNYLYHNLGGGKFKEMALDAGVAMSEDGVEQANMGLAVGDYMNVGRMSIAVTHFSDEYAALYRNDGNMNFTDVSRVAGIALPSSPYVGWGDAFLDLDNSGWLDLILVNGHVYPQMDNAKLGISYREPKLVFQNNRDGTFRNVSAESGAAVRVPQVSRGLAVGDLFNTGRLDVVVENLTGGPMILEAKSDPRNHWVGFQLEGGSKNRLALNARVRVTTGKLTQLGEVRSGGSYLSQSDLRLHFGLGDVTSIDKVEVLWPDGTSQSFENMAADRFYHLTEGGKLMAEAIAGRALR